MASIGYLIDGQEPDDWFGTLSKMSDKDGAGVKNRSAYMEGLKTKLAPITTEKKDNTKPLYYEPYEESYVSQGDDWTELALVDMDRINKGGAREHYRRRLHQTRLRLGALDRKSVV